MGHFGGHIITDETGYQMHVRESNEAKATVSLIDSAIRINLGACSVAMESLKTPKNKHTQ